MSGICTVCLRTGHTAASCKSRPRNGRAGQDFAAAMKAHREAPDEIAKPADDWEWAWERLCRDMRKGWAP